MTRDALSIQTDVIAPSRRRPWWQRAETVAAAAAIVCFINVLPNDYCYDDRPVVRFNAKVNDPGQWLTIWSTDYWSQTTDASPNRDLLYRPIALSSYRLIRIAGGGSPLPHHLFNIMLHALICVLTVRCCRHLGDGRAALRSEAAPLIAGVVFAVLPIHTEAVAAVVGRADLLATAGVLLTLLAHRRSMSAVASDRPASWLCQSSRSSDRLGSLSHIRWRVLAALAAFGAMGSKEVGITVVVLTVLFDGYWHGRLAEKSGGQRWWAWRTPLRLAYLLIPLTLYLALRYNALDGRLYQGPPLTKSINVLVDAPPWQHTLGVFQLWGMFWAKTVWPAVLSVKYSINSIRLATSVMDGHVLIGMLVAIVLCVTSASAWRKGIFSVALLSAAIGISYLPTANAFALIRVFFAERIWYLPSVWIVILAALACTLRNRLPGRSRDRLGSPSYIIRYLVFGVLALGMTLRCWVRNAEWKDNGTLYAAACRDQPDAVGPLHLYGEWLVHHGRYERGIALLNRAVEIDLGLTDAHRTLGNAHLRAGRLEDAIRYLQIADMQVPGHPRTAAALARVSRELSEHDEGLARLRKRLEDHPDDVAAEVALIRRNRELGLTIEALARLLQGEPQFSNSADWQAEYAVTLVFLDRRDEAIERYHKCLQLDPDDPQRAVELVMLLLERRAGNDLDRAWALVDHASSLAPGAPSVLACRAELLALRGDLTGAVGLYDQAIHALPPESDRRRIFEQRAKALGR